MNVGRYLRGEDRHVGSTRTVAKQNKDASKVTQLTDREILEACARAIGATEIMPFRVYEKVLPGLWIKLGETYVHFNPLENDGDCARLENNVGVCSSCARGVALINHDDQFQEERFTPGNDAERRRASCLVVARAQIEKEAGK